MLTQVEADTVAKICNDLINKNGVVLYGNLYESGESKSFKSEKSEFDSHVCIGIGMSEMGIFDETEVIAVNRPEDKDIVELTETRNKMLEREVDNLRGQK